jgi:hypothetical protein
MMMIKGDRSYEAGAPPPVEMMAAMGALTMEMMQKGVLLATEGLQPSSKGALVHAAGGKLTVKDGPFAESKEVIGGYAILQAASKEEAIAHVRRFMQVHIDVLGPSYSGECEVRPLFDPADFGQP